jgi:hypothetical protein
VLQTPPSALTDFLSVILPYVQLFGVVTICFTVAWWLHSSKSELFARLDKITYNHLSHIEGGITKLSESMPQFFEELHDHQTRTEVMLNDIRDEQRRQQ